MCVFVHVAPEKQPLTFDFKQCSKEHWNSCLLMVECAHKADGPIFFTIYGLITFVWLPLCKQ